MGTRTLASLSAEHLDEVVRRTAAKHGEDPAFLRRVLLAMQHLDEQGRITLQAIQSVRAD